MDKYTAFGRGYSNLCDIGCDYGISDMTLLVEKFRQPDSSIEDIILSILKRGTVTVEDKAYRNLADAATAYGILYSNVCDRLGRGWPLLRALKTPVKDQGVSSKHVAIEVFGTKYTSRSSAYRDLHIQICTGLIKNPKHHDDVVRLRVQIRELLEYSGNAVLPQKLPYAYVNCGLTYDISLSWHACIYGSAAGKRRVGANVQETIERGHAKFGAENVFMCSAFSRDVLQDLYSGIPFNELAIREYNVEYVRSFLTKNPDKRYMFENYINI